MQRSDHVYSVLYPLYTLRALDTGLLSLLASPSHHSHGDTEAFSDLVWEPDRVVGHGNQEGGAKSALKFHFLENITNQTPLGESSSLKAPL